MENRLRMKNCEVKALTDDRATFKNRLKIIEEEGKRQHERIVELVHIKVNLIDELDYQHCNAIHGFKNMQQELFANKKALAMKVSEVAGLQKEREASQKEMRSLKEELEASKLEVS